MLASIKKRLDDSNPARAATAVETPTAMHRLRA